MNAKAKSKVVYKAPIVLTATKKGSNFSAACVAKSGYMCISCRCS